MTAKALLQQKNQDTAFINSGTLNKELLAQQIAVCLIAHVSEKGNYQKIRFFSPLERFRTEINIVSKAYCAFIKLAPLKSH